MTRSTRTIELDDKDWEEADERGAPFSDCHDLIYLLDRFTVAAYKARSPEPKVVELCDDTWSLIPDINRWVDQGGYEAPPALASALNRIYELKHPEEAP